MYLGFDFSTRSGSSIGVDDFVIPDEKYEIVDKAEDEVKEIETNSRLDLLQEAKDITKWLIYGLEQ